LTGTWAERATWLYCQLCHLMDLEAVLIPGYWKEAEGIVPGIVRVAHNHAWAGVKVNGK
jgi:transglutaminase/protease-like cytokinesis protein 3